MFPRRIAVVDFIARRDLKGKGFVKLGIPVASLWHYRLLATDARAFYYSFYVTEDKRVAHLVVSTI